MDTVLSEEDILLYGRFKTKRQKIKQIKEGKDKSLLALNRQIQKLDKQIRNLGYVELDKPIFRGYKRFFCFKR
jgi:hypothetical protein